MPPSRRTPPRSRDRSPAGRRGARRSPARISTSSGAHAGSARTPRARPASGTPRRPTARHRQVDREPLARARPDVRRRPGPRIQRRTRGSRRRGRRNRAWKMSFVPLPWWTSQSTISTRDSAVRGRRPPRRDRGVAEEAEPHRARRLRVMPGRAQRAHAHVGLATQQRVDERDRAARGPQGRPERPGHRVRVGVDRAAARRAQLLDRTPRSDAGGRARSTSRETSGACTRARPEPAVRAHLRLQRPDPRRPLRMARARRGPARRRRAARSRGVSSLHRAHRTTSCRRVRSDLVVVGAGAAGLFAALTAAREGARITLVSARPLAETASYWAQGGAAAALAVDDSPELHLQDTLTAGRGLTRNAAAEMLTNEAADARARAAGARRPLRRRPPRRARARPGGRPQPRAGSSTPAGARPAAASCGRCRRRPSPSNHASTSSRASARPASRRAAASRSTDGRTLAARATILATGGAAALWSRTTNPPGSFGSGLLLARQAGAQLADLEFTQFHPTAVVGLKGREGFLITEAVRGEGATLHGPDGERFVDELSPARRRRARDLPPARGRRPPPSST